MSVVETEAHEDEYFMAKALELATLGLYSTAPNPRVGCVIVKNGRIVGQGWHVASGEAHAEVLAMKQAAAETLGATLYVNLEPCAHQGQTPPCVDAIIKAGISRVILSSRDSNPLVNGKGIERLKANGITVLEGLLAQKSRELNIGFFRRMESGKPWVRVKVAAGLDGKTALENGKSQWITSELAREDVHRWRARSCAVLTGVGTVVEDDPRLTVRYIETSRQPVKVVVDSQLRSPLSARLFKMPGATIATAVTNKERLGPFIDKGVNVLVLPDSNGRVDLAALLIELANQHMNEVLVEAGINLHSAFLRRNLIDEMIIYYAPKFLGAQGRGMFFLNELEKMDEVAERDIIDIKKFGRDFRVMVRF
ncbi:MAG: bifunctional diaminohydroxyphosphoribosylaminopyrimidine deaminase/5-amino-6-(5-phosphoribosylamino)uracil reductase RibD [Proteobacteria bacterium]|nr:bifunctional diaminohydroxyphosphoribosylaminopyrimidine deaminase/5-amino-6-(5-phosphoribosylamino)uracil reductase RibD [Pseudomonadota bacterium]